MAGPEFVTGNNKPRRNAVNLRHAVSPRTRRNPRDYPPVSRAIHAGQGWSTPDADRLPADDTTIVTLGNAAWMDAASGPPKTEAPPGCRAGLFLWEIISVYPMAIIQPAASLLRSS